jgi:hypothetical protein
MGMADTLWEVQDGERVLGPYPEQQVLESIARGLPAMAKVRRVGGEMWIPIGAREPFASAFRATPRAEVDRAAGVPLPRGKRPLTQDPIAMAGVGLLAAAVLCSIVLAARELSRPKPAASRPATVPAGAVTPADPVRLSAEAKMNAVAAVWAAYEKLPKERRTKPAWQDAWNETVQIGDTLRPPYDAIFRRANGALGRKHMGPLIMPNSRAVGPEFTIFEPSSTFVECVAIAALMASNDETTSSLQLIGFTKLVCEGPTKISSVTGNPIKEPDREWPIQ